MIYEKEQGGTVAGTFSYSVDTRLSRAPVWEILTDVASWAKFSDIYSDLRWDGTPWVVGSALVGQLNYPIVVRGRYLVKACDPPTLIRYLSQTDSAGFATERTIRLEELPNGTRIHVEAYLVGNPPMPGGALSFLSSLTTRWFDEFARFCDQQAERGERSAGAR